MDTDKVGHGPVLIQAKDLILSSTTSNIRILLYTNQFDFYIKSMHHELNNPQRSLQLRVSNSQYLRENVRLLMNQNTVTVK